MRVQEPRVTRAENDELDARQQAIVGDMNEVVRDLNLFRTMLNVPDAMTGLMGWGNYIQSAKNSLQGREKEIAILRVSFLTRCAYEWTHHVRIGLGAGLTEEEIEALKDKRPVHEWAERDAALIAASDELVRDHFIRSPTWDRVAAHYPLKTCMDIVFTVAHYAQVAKIANSFGIQVDANARYDEDVVDLE